jgi:hypothetical protein
MCGKAVQAQHEATAVRLAKELMDRYDVFDNLAWRSGSWAPLTEAYVQGYS